MKSSAFSRLENNPAFYFSIVIIFCFISLIWSTNIDSWFGLYKIFTFCSLSIIWSNDVRILFNVSYLRANDFLTWDFSYSANLIYSCNLLHSLFEVLKSCSNSFFTFLMSSFSFWILVALCFNSAIYLADCWRLLFYACKFASYLITDCNWDLFSLSYELLLSNNYILAKRLALFSFSILSLYLLKFYNSFNLA